MENHLILQSIMPSAPTEVTIPQKSLTPHTLGLWIGGLLADVGVKVCFWL
jgi:hypothetical protein